MSLDRVLARGWEMTEDVKRCFKETIPILENAESVFAENSFGFLSSREEARTWKGYGLIFNIEITYKDFEGKRDFRHFQNLKLADNAVFAGGSWGGDTAEQAKRIPRILEKIHELLKEINRRLTGTA